MRSFSELCGPPAALCPDWGRACLLCLHHCSPCSASSYLRLGSPQNKKYPHPMQAALSLSGTSMPGVIGHLLSTFALLLSRRLPLFYVFNSGLISIVLLLCCLRATGTMERFDWTNNYKQDGRPSERIWFGRHQPEGGRLGEGELFDLWLCCQAVAQTKLRSKQQCIYIYVHTHKAFLRLWPPTPSAWVSEDNVIVDQYKVSWNAVTFWNIYLALYFFLTTLQTCCLTCL